VAGRGAADDGRTDLLLATVRELAGELHGDGPAPVVRPGSRLDRELGLDSLAMAELLTRVERRFDVHLPDEVLATAQTPADLLQAIGAAPSRPTDDAEATPTGRPAQGQPAATGPARDADTLVEVLDHHAAGAPDRVHLRILDDAATVEVTHAQLFQDAAAVAAGLRDRGVGAGSVVAIMLPTSRDYFATFAGVLLAGAVPAPLYPPARPAQLEEHLRRHVRILDNAQAPMLVTVEEVRRVTRLISPQVPSLEHVVTVDELRPAGGGGSSPATVGPQATGLLQYTSGSTGDPKGVVLSHANLLANIRAICEAGEVDGERDVFVSWLPLYHDMGLIGAWLTSLYVGMPLVVMSPVAFLARPARWLRAIHEHGGTISGAPNFGYELAVKRIADEDLSGVDLSGWRVAFNGAEPVNPGTLRRFEERFAPHGLDRRALAPVYGLAECSVGLTIPRMGRGPVIDRITRSSLARGRRLVTAAEDDPDPAEFPACGRPLPGHELRIVDEQGREVEERTEGRIQFRGPSATSGYHRNPEATRALFDGDWLDTGDLGYLAGGELYPTGRVKDLIIRAGRNLHPAEVEDAIGAIDDVRTGCVAVFAASDEAGGTERLVVLAETRATDEQRLSDLRRAIVERVTDVTGLPPDEVVLVGAGVVPKTSSGKIRRAAARERFETDALEESTPAVWRQVLRLGRGSAVPAVTGAVRRAAARLQGLRIGAVLALAALVVWPLVAVLPGLDRRWRLVRRAGRVVVRAGGIPTQVHGVERFPTEGPYVVAANHASFLDPLFVAMVLPRRAVFSAVGGLADNPWVRVFLRRLEVQLVPRGDRRGGLDVTEALVEVVRSGRPVVFFPEGRRSTAPGLERFQMGAFTVASRAGVPVVPVALRGTRDLLPVGGLLPRSGRVTVTITEPVTTDGDDWAGAVELHRATRTAILEHCGEPDAA
jgi:1-acyl-sn-glycerol-3-phosphate acyltransferase